MVDSIYIKGARVNNLKNISVKISRNKLVVITGVSGSGKSSLAFDTLYAEGQRRYVESLNSYARQFLERMEKPDVDFIQGISPAMAIQQKVSTSNPRSTVGTSTEIYDFLKLLFARVGKTYSPVSGKLVTRDTVSDVVDSILKAKEGSKVFIYTSIPVRSKGFKAELELSLQKGFTRIRLNDEIQNIEDLLELKKLPKDKELTLLIDRLILRKEDLTNLKARLADSIQTAYQEGQSICLVQINDKELKQYSQKFEADGIEFERPSVNLFSFNNPYGACPTCEGFGRILGIDDNLVIPDDTKSLYDNMVAPWRGEKMSKYQRDFIEVADKAKFPIHKPYYQLSDKQKDQLWDGIPGAWGINKFFEYLRTKTHKIQYRVMLSRYRGYTTCNECKGSRVRKDANYVQVAGLTISELLFMQLDTLQEALSKVKLEKQDKSIAERILREINTRLDYLNKAGVNYLSLNRKLNTLSGGEMQRIRLATSLGSGLVGSMYILDEPSIGLHPRDTDKLIEILLSLRDEGNTVIVVEHDESIMKKADQLVDIGPGAGEFGGEIVFNGDFKKILKSKTLTADYLSGLKEIPLPTSRRKKISSIKITGARMHNLKNVDVEFPLHAMTLVTGVSGSGKSTLVQKILYPILKKHLGEYGVSGGKYTEFSGDLKLIQQVELVNQNPVGRSARSNPATYIKAYDHIRDLYAKQPMAKIKGLAAGSFSFNIDGGRCDACKGEGYITVEMQFLPDVKLLCESCKGRRFKRNVLDVNYRNKNIDDVLNMTISEAQAFFSEEAKIHKKLDVLSRVGLDYLRLGQSTSTLSGGEAQRMKLALFLSLAKDNSGTFFIFDEPTTGLHFDDIKKLLIALNELVERGNTVVIIEHNLDLIKAADWLIDLGPEGGDQGGQVIYQGRPEGILKVKKSHTARYLKEKM